MLYYDSPLNELVRVLGVEPSSQPWEGYILAAIRYPLTAMPVLEPPAGIEPATCALRMRCSTD